MSGNKDGLLYWPKFSLEHSSTSFASWLELLNRGSLRAQSPLQLVLTSASCLQLSQTVREPVILFSTVHLLPLFFRLFTQMHLLIDGSVEGQYITFYFPIKIFSVHLGIFCCHWRILFIFYIFGYAEPLVRLFASVFVSLLGPYQLKLPHIFFWLFLLS